MADDFWAIHQSTVSTDPTTSERAKTLYNLLENEYLEPLRRHRVRERTEEYKKVSEELAQDITQIREAIKEIKNIVDKARKITKYMEYFETAVKIGMRLKGAFGIP